MVPLKFVKRIVGLAHPQFFRVARPEADMAVSGNIREIVTFHSEGKCNTCTEGILGNVYGTGKGATRTVAERRGKIGQLSVSPEQRQSPRTIPPLSRY